MFPMNYGVIVSSTFIQSDLFLQVEATSSSASLSWPRGYAHFLCKVWFRPTGASHEQGKHQQQKCCWSCFSFMPPVCVVLHVLEAGLFLIHPGSLVKWWTGWFMLSWCLEKLAPVSVALPYSRRKEMAQRVLGSGKRQSSAQRLTQRWNPLHFHASPLV